MTLDDPLHADAVAGILALASEVADGCVLGVVGADGRLVAGALPPGPADALPAHPVLVRGMEIARVVSDGASPGLLTLVARTIELALGAADEAAARTRMAEELSIGRRIQRSLIPRRFPDVAGWTFGAAYEAAREVGGDLYDAFQLRDRPRQFGLLVADVTGKGIPAALLMADVRALLHSAADNAEGPADALTRVNRILVRERATSLFVTAALVIVDGATGDLRYASAGHEPPVIAGRDGGLLELAVAGPLLGAFEDAAFEERRDRVEPGEALVLYTDGVTETRDAARAFYGEERLFASIGDVRRRAASDVADGVMAPLRAFRGEAEPFDDLTLLVAARRPPDEPGAG